MDDAALKVDAISLMLPRVLACVVLCGLYLPASAIGQTSEELMDKVFNPCYRPFVVTIIAKNKIHTSSENWRWNFKDEDELMASFKSILIPRHGSIHSWS